LATGLQSETDQSASTNETDRSGTIASRDEKAQKNMIEMILFSAPALLAGMIVGLAMGWKIGKFGQKPLAAEVERLKVLTQQQAKQIWNQADRIHELEIDKLQLSSWQRSEGQRSEGQRSEAQPSGNTRPSQFLEGQRRRAVA
jgi:hypothetical protein